LDDTDVLVVGGGIVGCSAAYYLARFGIDVALVERDDLNTGASGANAGSLHAQLTSRYFTEGPPARIEAAARALIPLSRQAVDTWGELARELDRDIEFKTNGGLMAAESPAEMEVLRRKATLEQAAGLDVHVLARSEARSFAPYLAETVLGIEVCPIEGKINPLLATPALARGAARAGARIHRHAGLLALEREKGTFVAKTPRGAVRCRRVVDAAGVGAAKVAAMVGLHLPGEARLQHMNVTARTEPFLPHLVQHAGKRLTMKQSATGTVIIGGGLPARRDPATGEIGVLRDSIAINLGTARNLVPAVARLQLLRTWGGESLMTDGNPVLGAVPSVAGFHLAIPANSGITSGPLCARLVAESLSGRRPSLDLDAFSIERF
jgi:glycine/D-amino acid oxidase-like deaminating enzyme